MRVTPEMREVLFRYDADSPLELERHVVEQGGTLVRERLAYDSINLVRVPALLTYDVDTPAPRPALLLQHGLNSSKDDPRMRDLAAAWARHGFACLTIDAPLHGERASGEIDLLDLLARPYSSLRMIEQNVVDLRRALDVLEAHDEIDAARIAYVGFSMSTFLGVQFVAVEPRVQAACFALGGAGLFHFLVSRAPTGRREDQEFVADLIDPLHFAPKIAPRPVLQVNSHTDELVPAVLGHMLHGALNEPKQIIWFEGPHGVIPDEVLAGMRRFLETALGVPDLTPR